ncbi:MAG: hypothetical protein M1812_001161 [Candelaria pacifica]|nr:MAG: hypothetical protein M1812_001161 [Candelaria pacifica]
MASAANAAKKRIVVCGGNGFLGTPNTIPVKSKNNLKSSPSRSGEPTWSSVSSSSNAPSWSTSVSWQKADILKPTTYTPLLKDADAVVHSMGILLEADYKGVLTGKESIVSGLQRAFSATKQGSQNPLERKEDEGLESQEKDGQITYELMNRDSAIALARQTTLSQIPTFAYISAAAGAPILPQRYITTKRDAETTISSSFPSLRSIFIRPGFLYDSSRIFTMPLAALTGVAAMANSMTGGRLTWLMGAGGITPLKADLVAAAVVEALGDEKVRGVVETGEIEMLATKAWRRGML